MSNPYIPNDTERIGEKLKKSIGIKAFDELYSDIREKIRLKRTLCLPGPLSEIEAKKEVEKILQKKPYS